MASGNLKLTGKRVVAICTGHGMKDPDIITKDMQKPLIVPPKLEALEEVILGKNFLTTKGVVPRLP
jgi:threonine synthase